jgi:hypothetical protein
MERTPQESAPPARPRTSPAAGRPQLGTLAQMPQVRIGAIVALAIVAGLVVWLLTSGNNNSAGKGSGATAASIQGLQSFTASVHHPVYWAGPKQGFTYELTRTADGKIYIRYLPRGVPVGRKGAYLSIGTYPLKNALAAVRAIATREHGATITLAGGGTAVQDKNHPTSVYFAYPGSNYQVEVFDPSPARARQLVVSGQVSAVGSTTATPPKAATVQQLRSLQSSLGHPVYWAGPRPGMTYELVQRSDGSIYLRYLPAGTKLGDRTPHTTVGTYPVHNAVAAIKTIAKQTGGQTFSIPGGGLAVVDGAHPTSVYAAFPRSDYEIEVFDPSAARGRRLVNSGRIVPVG